MTSAFESRVIVLAPFGRDAQVIAEVVTGLATDVLTLQQLLKFKLNMYKLREEREMKPETF